MKEKFKNNPLIFINITIFLFLLIVFPLIFLIQEDKLIDKAERRYLTQFPKFEEIKSFSEDFEDYTLDQFPFRYQFRQLKSIFNYYIFNKTENDNIVLQENIAIKLTPNFNYDKVITTLNKLNKIQKQYFLKNNCYFVLIPDKSCYNITQNNINCDYLKTFNLINKNTNMECINIFDELELNDYYKTDSHWQQHLILDVSNKILKNMNIETKDIAYKQNIVNDFDGVYISQTALPLKSENITYLTNEIINNAKVYNFETNKETPVYDLDKLSDEKSLDKYDIYLSGSSALLKITNEKQTNGKSLIIFRDSFGSSITPLFIEYYTNIYLVDLRYLSSSYISKYIDIKEEDTILFMYSTTLMEIPENFKIQ